MARGEGGGSRPLNKAARNERVKIVANWFNSASIAAIAVGCLAPIVNFFSSGGQIPPTQLFAIVAGFLLISLALHHGAKTTLRRIEE